MFIFLIAIELPEIYTITWKVIRNTRAVPQKVFGEAIKLTVRARVRVEILKFDFLIRGTKSLL